MVRSGPASASRFPGSAGCFADQYADDRPTVRGSLADASEGAAIGRPPRVLLLSATGYAGAAPASRPAVHRGSACRAGRARLDTRTPLAATTSAGTPTHRHRSAR